MKIVINETGKIEEVSEKIASRLINKGKAHPVQLGGVVSEVPKLSGDLIVPPELKMVESVTEIDLIEPIPERFTSFEVPKPKKKSRKKKSEFGLLDD